MANKVDASASNPAAVVQLYFDCVDRAKRTVQNCKVSFLEEAEKLVVRVSDSSGAAAVICQASFIIIRQRPVHMKNPSIPTQSSALTH